MNIWVLLLSAALLGQGETTSAIDGVVLDPAGAAIPQAVVIAIGTENGSRRTATTDEAGRYSFPQLKPGTYVVRAAAAGFEEASSSVVSAGLGQRQAVNFKLKLPASREEVTVTMEAPLVNTENPNTSTTLNAKTLGNLPNPGGDMTYPLQFAAGALINTAGSGNDFVGGTNGYGNVQFNGLPSLSNGYIVDGLETNDPLTNLNSGLSTNLVLGLNSIAEVTVNSVSYAADQGRYGASQVNYVTKSGTNQFHGNLYELWNGSRFNAANFFTNSTPGNQKPRSTVNHFGGSMGGPILRDKLFFFFDSEWVRIALPIVSAATVPSPAFQSYVLGQLPAASVPFYKQMFALYRNTSGTPLAVIDCPLDHGVGCANRRIVSQSSADHEQVQTARVDYNASERNTAWLRLQYDGGLQAAYTDAINPLFNAISPQPLYSAAAGYTHVFSPKVVNYFNPAFSWYQSLFGPADLPATLAAFPIVLQADGAGAPFSTLGGLDNTWVQGRRASRLFINDNLAWAIGAHELRLGTNTRVLRLNDYDFGEGATPLVTYSTLSQYIHGIASTATRTFPLADSQPYNFLNLDLYAQDTWKVTSKLTWTFGVRATHNSNPVNPHRALSRLKGSFGSISHDPKQPLNAAIQTNVENIFEATPLAIWQPRTAIALQLRPHTIVRSGFGLFSDLLPGSVVDLVGANPPYSQTFTGGLLGTAGGTMIAPGVADSAIDATIAANRIFQQGFASGRSGLPPVSITAVPDGKLHAPYFMQWSFAVEQQVGGALNLRLQYVGTRAVNQPYTTQVNGYQTVCAGCFAPFPYAAPLDARFGAVTQLNTGANSHYNGLQLTAEKRLSHGLQAQVNYSWSHCIDTVSNGGFLPFSAGGIISPIPGELQRDRGPCDYDVRHNFTASYAYELPLKLRNHLLATAFNGWQLSGSVFDHSGIPFSVRSAPYSANGNGIVNGSGPQFASVVAGVPQYLHSDVPGITPAGAIQWLNPAAFVSTVDPRTGACAGGDSPQNCQFGNLGRNALRGPNFTWSDLYLTKWFPLSERVKLRVDAQFFNLFNHPNFGLPVLGYAGAPGFGALTYTTAPPTGLLGVGLGGDSSPRMIAFQGRIEF